MNVQNLTGKTVKGYELRDMIGQGSFGAVYQAYQPAIQREVAVKIILPKYANHPDFIRNFEYEAQLVARLEHPHIVPLYDYWREPDSAALVMRLLRGGSLEDKVFQGPLDLDFVIRVLDQIAAALMVAHRNGVIHRDIKPANMMLDGDENAYLADFGIAKEIMSQPQEIIEKASSITGSPAYVSPEQLKSERLSPQTDLYSLGIVLFELVTGKLPFGEDLALPSLLFKHLHDPIPSLHVYRPDVPAGLDHVLQRATAKNPKDRYPDSLSLARAFKQACRRYEGAPVTKQTPRPGELSAAIDEALLDTLSIQSMTNPYKGLRAFEEADAPDFFGRSALVDQLLERLREPQPEGAFLAIIGPSGSGKSSVVSAGLIPALRQGAIAGSEHWFIVEMQPGHQPFEELSQAILRVAARPPASLHSLKSTENGLLRVMQDVLPDNRGELLLVINQFEELFTQVPQEDVRQHFLNSLVQALTEPDTPLRVVVNMRADFYDRPLRYPAFGRLVRSRTEVVLPLSPEELEQAIVGPASRVGLILEPGLVHAIIQDVSEQPGALPLLQYALTELFERREGRTLTLNAYHDSGGVLGALARRAEEIYKGLHLDEQQAARQVLLRLVTVGEGAEDTRRRVRKAELMAIDVPDDALNKVIDLYSKYRLLTFDRDPVTREPTVEVAHEALIREWNRLRAWLANSREDMRTQRRLAALADEWVNSDRNISYLATGPRLAQLNQWKEQTDLVLTALEREFLEESNANRYVMSYVEKRRKAQVASLQRRSEKFLIALVGVLLVAILVVAVLFGFSLRQRDRARDNERAAERSATAAQSVALAANAQQALAEGDTELAVVLALDAVDTPNPSSSVQRVLADAAYSPGTRAILAGHEGQVYDVAFSPDGTIIASGGADGLIILWDQATGQENKRLEGHTATVTSLDFSSDGRWLLSGSIDRSVRLWDVATGILISRFLGDVEGVWSVALSPDMQTAVSGTSDDEITVWDVNTGKAVRQLEGHAASVYSLAFNRDGTRLLSGSADNTLILWDYVNGRPIRQIRGHSNFVYDVAFSPDESTALSASWDRTLRTWDLTNGRELVRFVGHTAPIYTGDFSQTGQYIVSGSEDQTMILWDVATGEAIYQVKAHAGTVNRVNFSPDGAMVVSASYDGTARLWRFRNGAVEFVLADHSDRVSSVAYSADGQTILSASWDNSLRLWDAKTGQLVRRFGEQTSTGDLVRLLEGHTDRINTIAISPDGAWAASGSRDRSVILWDVVTGTPIRQLTGHTDQITGVAFTPDGKYVLSSSRDETLRLWDVESGELVREFVGHNDRVLCVAISPDGKTAVSGGRNGFILVWDIASGRETRRIRSNQSAILALVVSPDGKLVASGSEDSQLLLWNIQRSQIAQQLEGHTASINTVAFSPDGQWLISGSSDATVRLWDVALGEEIRRLVQHREAVTGVAFGPDGRTAVSGSWDHTVLLWRTPPLPELIEWTRANRYLRELTCRDREQYHVTPLCKSSAG